MDRPGAVSGKVDVRFAFPSVPAVRFHSSVNLLNLDQMIRLKSIPIEGGLA
jgi:hypothetical protein